MRDGTVIIFIILMKKVVHFFFCRLHFHCNLTPNKMFGNSEELNEYLLNQWLNLKKIVIILYKFYFSFQTYRAMSIQYYYHLVPPKLLFFFKLDRLVCELLGLGGLKCRFEILFDNICILNILKSAYLSIALIAFIISFN